MEHLFEPWEKLIRIVILGKEFRVPENNLLLRQMSYVAPDISSGRYCWNGECRYCEVQYRRDAKGEELAALSCRIKGLEGMRITKIAFEMKYNMSQALAAALKAKD